MSFLINQKVNWESENSYYFFNPKQRAYEVYHKYLPKEKNRIYVMSSGSGKIIGLSKKAFLISAQSVNQHLKVTQKDRLFDVLPFFHVASISLQARSFCGKCAYFESVGSWNPKTFKEEIESNHITITSLVPTQIYDLVQMGVSPNSDLRAVVVGGAHLDSELYKKARKLKWPILPSYGLTEMASQVATASLSSLKETEFPLMQILSHVEVKESSRLLELRSQSLLEGELDLSTKKWKDISLNEASWFQTEDRGEVKDAFLKVYGRESERIKISGELVDLNELSKIITSLLKEAYVVATPCERRGFQVDLITTSINFLEIQKVVEKFNKKVSPYKMINNVYLVKTISLGVLSKIKQELLKKQIGFSS